MNYFNLLKNSLNYKDKMDNKYNKLIKKKKSHKYEIINENKCSCI